MKLSDSMTHLQSNQQIICYRNMSELIINEETESRSRGPSSARDVRSRTCLGILEVAEPEVQGGHVVQNFWRDFRVDLFGEDGDGSVVCRQCVFLNREF